MKAIVVIVVVLVVVFLSKSDAAPRPEPFNFNDVKNFARKELYPAARYVCQLITAFDPNNGAGGPGFGAGAPPSFGPGGPGGPDFGAGAPPNPNSEFGRFSSYPQVGSPAKFLENRLNSDLDSSSDEDVRNYFKDHQIAF